MKPSQQYHTYVLNPWSTSLLPNVVSQSLHPATCARVSSRIEDGMGDRKGCAIPCSMPWVVVEVD